MCGFQGWLLSSFPVCSPADTEGSQMTKRQGTSFLPTWEAWETFIPHSCRQCPLNAPAPLSSSHHPFPSKPKHCLFLPMPLNWQGAHRAAPEWPQGPHLDWLYSGTGPHARRRGFITEPSSGNSRLFMSPCLSLWRHREAGCDCPRRRKGFTGSHGSWSFIGSFLCTPSVPKKEGVVRRLRKDENVRRERERAILVSIATTHVSQLLSPWKQGEPAQSLHCLRGDNF